MALYRFKVSDPNGKISELLVEGDSQTDVTRRLQRRGVLPLEFLGEGSMAATSRGSLGLRQRFDVVDFTDRLVPLLEAQIPIENALAVVGEGFDDEYSSRIIADLRRGLHEGRKFSDLIRDRGRLFPRLYGSVVEAGEEAGALPQVMGELRRFLNDSRELRSFIISAAIYPLFVISASSVMLAVLLFFVIPRFAQVLQSAQQEMPRALSFLLAVSNFSRSYWWIFPLSLILVVYLLLQLRHEGKVKAIYDDLILAVPFAGKMVLLSNLARMCRTMSILMRSGVHLLDTVGIANRVVQNRTLSQSLTSLAAELRQGQRLSHALGHSRFIPSFMLRMIGVGEETGSVDSMLERIADRYEVELKRNIQRFLSLMEPAIIILLGVLVGGVVLVMFMAIMNMQTAY